MASASDENPYLIHSGVEIAYALNELRKARTPMSCEISRSGDRFTTEILAVDAENHIIMLDIPPLQTQLDNALGADALILRTSTSRARLKIEFELDHVKSAQWEGSTALCAQIPRRILKIQRRDFFRIGIPRTRAVTCEIEAPGAQPFVYKVLDIGLGGVALISKEGEPPLEEGKVYEKCRITLPDVGAIEPRVLVRHVAITRAADKSSMHRYGCEFAELPGAQESLIQRFVLQLERDVRAAGRLVE